MRKTEKIAVTCAACPIVFYVHPCHVSRRKYCSKQCACANRNRWYTPKTCDICHQPYMAKDKRGRFCKVCVPNADWLGLAQHYHLSKSAYEALVATQHNRCKICGCSPTGS